MAWRSYIAPSRLLKPLAYSATPPSPHMSKNAVEHFEKPSDGGEWDFGPPVVLVSVPEEPHSSPPRRDAKTCLFPCCCVAILMFLLAIAAGALFFLGHAVLVPSRIGAASSPIVTMGMLIKTPIGGRVDQARLK